jgi:hypothetical protein
VKCKVKDFSGHQFSCPDGFNYTVYCNGTESTLAARCPKTMRKVPNCNALNGLKGSCEMVDYTDEIVSCVCEVKPQTASIRKLSAAAPSYEFVSVLMPVQGKPWISFGSVTTDSTFFLAALSILCVILFLVMISIIGSWYFNFLHKKKNPNLEKSVTMLKLSEKVMPTIYRSKPTYYKVLLLLKQYHKVSMMLFSKRFAHRSLHLLSMVTHLIVILFVAAIICAFFHKTPIFTAIRTINIAFFSLVVSIPVGIAIDWMIQHILVVPKADPLKPNKGVDATVVVKRAQSKNLVHQPQIQQLSLPTAHSGPLTTQNDRSIEDFISHLQHHREGITNITALQKFDGKLLCFTFLLLCPLLSRLLS